MKVHVNKKRFTAFLMIIFTIYIFSMHYKTIADSLNISAETNKYVAMLEEEKQKNAKLIEQKNNMESDEYYEEIARDDLGLLKNTQILYINADDQ